MSVLNWERIISYFTGYVEILIRGAQAEKIINLATSSGLYLWGVRRIAPEIVYAKIRIFGYLRMREMVKISGCRVKIHHKHGWPFLYHKIISRKMFLIGAVLAGVLVVYISSFVLLVKIDGFEGKNHDRLIRSLRNAGLKAGISRHDLLLRKRLIEQEMMLSHPEAVWIGISVRGVVAEVKVVPRKTAPVSSRPCDIVARHDGVISKVVAIRGVPVVQEGDTVAQGELLISGKRWRSVPESDDFIEESITAGGVVEARVWYDIEVIEPKVIWVAQPQKGRAVRYRLRIGDRLWNVAQFGKRPTGTYFWERSFKRIYQGRNPFEGVELIKDTFQKVVYRKVKRTPTEIRQSALAEAAARQKRLKNITVTHQTKSWTDEGRFVKLNLTLETVQDIGMASPHR